MERINYQHLFYFWNVACEESVTRACEKLHLAQPTVSGQLAVFEKAIGEKLFRKNGRKLALTDTGRVVFRYADEIFSLGRELTNTLKGRTPPGRMRGLGVWRARAGRRLSARFSPFAQWRAVCAADRKHRPEAFPGSMVRHRGHQFPHSG